MSSSNRPGQWWQDNEIFQKYKDRMEKSKKEHKTAAKAEFEKKWGKDKSKKKKSSSSDSSS